MISCNHIYKNTTNLKQFISAKNIQSSTNILVQIFISVDDSIIYHNIQDLINACLPQAQVLGVLSKTNFIPEQTITTEPVVSFTLFEDSSFHLFSYDFMGEDLVSIGTNLAKDNFKSNTKTAVIYSNLSLTDCESVLTGINSVSSKVMLSGGLIDNTLFIGNCIINNGFIGYAIHNKNLISNYLSSNYYMPIGKEHKITSCENNIIKSIDDFPAIEFHRKYLGADTIDDSFNLVNRFPLMIQQDTYHVPKPIISVNSDGCLITATSINEGDIVCLGCSNIINLLEQNKEIASDIFDLPKECAFVFSSSTRLNSENNTIQYNFTHPNIPLCGFMTEAEIQSDGNKAFISVGSVNILLLSENINSSTEYCNPFFEMDLQCNDQQLALHNLIKNTSTELNLMNKKLQNLVIQKNNEILAHYYLDELTALPNLNRLNERIKNNEVTSLALIDIKSFFNINSFYGNTFGNKILSELSDLITSSMVNSGYNIYRIHSDIFAITASDNNKEQFNDTIELLQGTIHGHCFFCNALTIYITTLVAISHNQTNIYDYASMTLEYAKGHDLSFLTYSTSLNIESSIENNLIWTAKIKTAIKNDRITPYFQPLFNNKTEKIDGYEVLMRLIDEENNVFTPNYFLDIAKKANLYKPLTKIMIKKSFDYFKDMDNIFSINLSSEDILDKKIRNFIYTALENYPNAHNVIFEIVESESIENFEEVKHFINKVKKYGVRIAIDDFGSGFSNFLYLLNLNVDIIKIDGDIIQHITNENTAFQLTETIVDLAHKIGAYTIAEFVSDQDIFHQINAMGISFSQGYYVSRPLEKINLREE